MQFLLSEAAPDAPATTKAVQNLIERHVGAGDRLLLLQYVISMQTHVQSDARTDKVLALVMLTYADAC